MIPVAILESALNFVLPDQVDILEGSSWDVIRVRWAKLIVLNLTLPIADAILEGRVPRSP